MPGARLQDVVSDFESAFLAAFSAGYLPGDEQRVGFPQPLDVSATNNIKSIVARATGARASGIGEPPPRGTKDGIGMMVSMQLIIYQPRVSNSDMLVEAERVLQWLRSRLVTAEGNFSIEGGDWAVDDSLSRDELAKRGAMAASVFSFIQPAIAYSDEYYAAQTTPRGVAKTIYINGEQSSP